jgi:glucose-1-phosphate thymidylyltransferase
MHAIVLAAGYGTRLGALGTHMPKALLALGSTTVLDALLAHLNALGIRDALLVTNAKFHAAFEVWARAYAHALPVKLLCDGSATPEDRLGAVRDLALGLAQVDIAEGVFVSAADTVYDADLGRMLARYHEVVAPVIALMPEKDEAVLMRSGVAVPGPGGRIVSFHEKPAVPPSAYGVPPLYVYPPDIRADIDAFLATSGLDHDAPGHLVAFLVTRRPVYGVILEGAGIDIGSPESYAAVRRRFGG